MNVYAVFMKDTQLVAKPIYDNPINYAKIDRLVGHWQGLKSASAEWMFVTAKNGQSAISGAEFVGFGQDICYVAGNMVDSPKTPLVVIKPRRRVPVRAYGVLAR